MLIVSGVGGNKRAVHLVEVEAICLLAERVENFICYSQLVHSQACRSADGSQGSDFVPSKSLHLLVDVAIFRRKVYLGATLVPHYLQVFYFFLSFLL